MTLPLLVLLFYWRCAIGLAIPFFEDIVSLHHPLMSVFATALKGYRLPLWAPDILGGYPLMAEGQVGIFYPANLFLLFLLSPERAQGLSLVVHASLAGVFMYAFGTALGLSVHARAISSIAFMFSGFFVGHMAHLNFLYAAPYLPLLFYCAEVCARRTDIRFAVLWGAAWGMQLLASAPQLALYSLFSSGIYYAYRSLSAPSRERPFRVVIQRIFAQSSLGLLIGLALSAVQTIPQYELASLSARREALSFEAAIQSSLPPINLITYVFPSLFGVSELDRFVYSGEPFQWGLTSWWEASVYVGVFPLLFAIFALRSPRQSGVGFFSLLAAGSLLVAFGRYTPLGHLVHLLPGFGYFRAPARVTYLTTFAVSVLSGFGADRLREPVDWEHYAKLTRRFLIGLLAMIGGLNVLVMGPTNWSWFAVDRLVQYRLSRSASTEVSDPGRHEDRAVITTRMHASMMRSILLWNPSVLLPLALVGSAWLLASQGRRYPFPASRLHSLGIVLTVLDLYAFHAKLVPLTPVSAINSEPAIVPFFKPLPSPYRIWVTDDVPRWWRARFATGHGPTEPNPELRRKFLLPNTNMTYGIRGIGGANQLFWVRYAEVLSAIRSGAPIGRLWLDLLSVKYLVAPRDTPAIPGQTRLSHVQGDVWIFENLSARPRVLLVHAFRLAHNLQRGLRDLPTVGWDPSREVILEEDPRIRSSLESKSSAVEVLSEREHEVVLMARSSNEGVLVLSDLYYPGWRVFVNGQEKELLKANYLFRGVVLSSGPHLVRFVYEPFSVRLGMGISGVTWAILILASFGWLTRLRLSA